MSRFLSRGAKPPPVAVAPRSRLESHCMSTAVSTERRKPWEEHSVAVALLLAILVPGLGHLFQGRTLKGLIYLFGILGLYLWGVKLGEGVVVYNQPEKGIFRRVTLHFAAQFGTGVISYPALWQQRRVNPNQHTITQLSKPLSAGFTGLLTTGDDNSEGKLSGTVNFKPEAGTFGTDTVGTFSGTLNGQNVELKLAGGFELDPAVGAGYQRMLRCNVVTTDEQNPVPGRVIVGSIPRPLLDWYGVAPEEKQLQRLTGRLGKVYELALVFTWIAGLLNILAIWDCVQGPAYGFGDEPWTVPSHGDNSTPSATPAPVAATTAAASPATPA